MTQNSSTQVWDGVATALEYPQEKTTLGIQAAIDGLTAAGDDHLALVDALHGLIAYLNNAPPAEPEEHYTILFDLKPVCALYVGWHIFADTYQRGALLAGLAEELRLAEVPHKHDLPDYLPTLLRLVPRLRTDEDRTLLVHGIILQGLPKIETALGESSAPWAAVIETLREWLEETCPRGTTEVPRLRQSLEVLPC